SLDLSAVFRHQCDGLNGLERSQRLKFRYEADIECALSAAFNCEPAQVPYPFPFYERGGMHRRARINTNSASVHKSHRFRLFYRCDECDKSRVWVGSHDRHRRNIIQPHRLTQASRELLSEG